MVRSAWSWRGSRVLRRARSTLIAVCVLVLVAGVSGTSVAQANESDASSSGAIPTVNIPPRCDANSTVSTAAIDDGDDDVAQPAPTPEPSPTSDSEPDLDPDPVVDAEPEPQPSVEPEPEPEPERVASVVCAQAVSAVSAVAGMNAANLSWVWSDARLSDGDVAFYIEVSSGVAGAGDRVVKVAGDSRALVVDGLRNGVEYSFAVHVATSEGSTPPTMVAVAQPTTGVEGEVAGVIVIYAPGAAPIVGDAGVPGAEGVEQVGLVAGGKVTEDAQVVEFTEAVDVATAREIAAELAAQPQIASAEPDMFLFVANDDDGDLAQSVTVPDDPDYAVSQWNLWDSYGIGVGEGAGAMTQAWVGPRGEGVTVAVIDTGITAHPDLDGQVVPGYDFVSNPEQLASSRQANAPPVAFDGDYVDENTYGALGRDGDPSDPGDWRGVTPVRDSSWHGTKIAGIIAAAAGNGEGIAGIAPGAKVQPIRALSWRGGLLSDIAASITWASGGVIEGVPANQTPSKVINLSFAVEALCPVVLQAAIDEARERGSIVVAAAGNAGDDAAKFTPGNCGGVITVGASNRDGQRASYSNYGPMVDVSAPGGDAAGPIATTSNAGLESAGESSYGSAQGTSVAAAHVSAAAAILASRDPNLTPEDAYTQLTGNDFTKAFANDTCDAANPDYECGTGILSLAQIATVASGDKDFAMTFSGASNSASSYATSVSTNYLNTMRGAFTIEAWVRPTTCESSGIERTVLEKRFSFLLICGNGPNWALRLTSGTTADANPNWFDPQVRVQLNQWQHIAFTRESQTSRIEFYFNGALARTFDPWNFEIGPSDRPLNVGNAFASDGSALGYPSNFIGQIDEVRLYNTYRGSSIATDMHTYGPTNAQGLLAYYDFNEGPPGTTGPGTVYNRAVGATSATNLRTVNGPTYNDVKVESTSGTSTVVTFPRSYLTAAGGWRPPQANAELAYLVVGAGGAGGTAMEASAAGGGGGGQVQTGTVNRTGTPIAVTVGMGGLPAPTNAPAANPGGDGGSSTFGGTTSAGGGGGASHGNGVAGSGSTNGFTGGGGAGQANRSLGSVGTGGEGHKGGNGFGVNDGSLIGQQAGGGGGGAGGAGIDAAASAGGNGGAGVSSSINNLRYGGGGGGGKRTGDTGLAGSGVDGGGAGGRNAVGSPGAANRGGGGGGGGDANGGNPALGGRGGSGVVIVSYASAAGGTCSPAETQYVDKSDGKTYRVVAFKDAGSCDWKVPTGVSSVSYVVVGGGGGGGAGHGGGGGAGGLQQGTSLSVTPENMLAVNVGSGGAAGVGGVRASNGTASSLAGAASSITANGGGGGGSSGQNDTNENGADGASGGGAARSGRTAGTGSPGGSGGVGLEYSTGPCFLGGGGGGSSAAGAAATAVSSSSCTSGSGGSGAQVSWLPVEVASLLRVGEVVSSDVFFSGGGAGSAVASPSLTPILGRGGNGGGGDAISLTSGSSEGGQPNTGGGGAAASANVTGAGFVQPGTSGGSGVVVLRYVQPANTTCTPLTYRYSDDTNTYTVVEFQGAGECDWTVPDGVTRVDALVVGAGGGGGSWVGGGGGGGGVRFVDDSTIAAGSTLSITVGAGGKGSINTNANTGNRTDATTGASSAFGSLTVDGGGHGASYNGQSPGTGANGGGGGSGAGGVGSSGRTGGTGNSTNPFASGGGAGASENGTSGLGFAAGNGGAGVVSSITGGSIHYGGGGGGGVHGDYNNQTWGSAGTGGIGGGGAGMSATSSGSTPVAMKGTDGLGGGGGGAAADSKIRSTGGDGGDGVVIVRYVNGPDAPTSVTAVATAPNEVTVSWTAPAYFGDDSIVGYDVLVSTDDSTFTSVAEGTCTSSASSTDDSCTVTGLTMGQQYFFRVQTRTSDRTTSYVSSESTSSGAVTPFGPLAKFTVTDVPSGAIGEQTAGSAFSVRITALDDSGQVVLSYDDTVALTSTSSISVGGGSRGPLVKGVFDDSITLTTAGSSQTITATGSGEEGESSSFTVQAATPSAVKVTTSPSDGRAGISLPTQPKVAVEDSFGNLVDWDDTTVITVTATPAATLSNPTRTVSGGTAMFSGLSVDDSVGQYTLTFTASVLGSGDDSAVVTITPGDVAKLALTIDDTNPLTAGSTRNLTATLSDAFGNVTTDDSSSVVDFTQSGTEGRVTFPPNADDSTSVTVASGVARATVTGSTAGAVDLVATVQGSSPAIDDTVGISVVAGTPAALNVSWNTSSAFDAGSPFTVQPTVSVLDDSGNVVMTDSSTVVTASVSAGSLIGDDTAQAVNGVATFTNLGISGPPGDYTVTFSSGSLADDTQSVTLQVGPAAVLDDSTPAGASTYGAAFGVQPVVTIDDSAGNLVTTSTAAVTATITDDTGTVLQTQTVNAVAGVATFTTLGDDSAVIAGTHTITFTSPGLTAFTQTIEVAQATPTAQTWADDTRVFDSAPATLAPPQVDGVYAETNLSGTWSYVSDDTAVVTVSGATVTITGVGASIITGTFTPDDSVNYTTTTATMTLAVVPDAPTAVLVAKTSPGAVEVSWTAPTYAPIADYTVLISTDDTTFAAVSQGTCAAAVVATSCTVTNLTPGTAYYFQVVANAEVSGVRYASDPSASSAAVEPFGPVATFAVTGLDDLPISMQTAGSAFSVRITALDDSGQVVLSYDDTVAVTSTSSISVGGGSVGPLADGVFDDSITLTSAGAQTITVTGGGKSGTSASFTVRAATPSAVNVTTPPSDGRAGIALPTQPVVQVEDAFGNLVDWDDTTLITVTASPAATLSNVTRTVSGGTATFSGLSVDDSVGEYTLIFTASVLGSGDDSAVVTITPGVVAALALTIDDINPLTVGYTRNLTATLSDAYGNVATDDSSSIVDFTQSGTGSVSFADTSVTVASGTAVVTVIGQGVGDVDLIGTVRGSSPAIDDTLTISVVSGVPEALKVTTLPSSPADAGSVFSTQPQVSVKDANGNVVVSDSSTVVTASVSVGGSLVGDDTAQAVNGVATFTNLGISGPPDDYTLTFSSPNVTDDSVIVTLQVGPAAALDDSTPAGDATYGAAFGVQPVVTIDDSAGNVVTTSTAAVTATITDGTGTVLQIQTVNAVAGVATFTTLGDDSAVVAGTHTITFTSPGLASFDQSIEVAQKQVEVTASSPTVVYGTAAPLSIAASFNGFAYTDDSTVLTTQPSCSSDYVATDGVGSSASTSCSGAVAANYTFTYVSGAVSVTKAPVTITAGATSVTYGTPTPPAVTFTATGLVNAEDTSVFTTQPTCDTTGYDPNAAPGTTFVNSCFGADADNYSFIYVSALLTMEKADQDPLTVTSTAGTFGTSLQLTAMGGSGTGARTWALAGGGTAPGCSVTDDSLTSSGAGTCVVTVTQADDINYNAVTSAETTITLGQATPTVQAWADSSLVFGADATSVAPPQVDGVSPATDLAGTWAYASGNTAVATASGTSLTPTGVGASTITGNFTPDDSANYTTTTTTMTLTVVPDAPTAVTVAKTAPGEVEVSWTAPTYTPITDYSMFISTDDTTFSPVALGTCATAVTGTSCTVTNLTPGTAYYFQVVANAEVNGVSYASAPSASSAAVEPFGVATQVVVTTAPVAGASGSALTTQPVVQIRDANGQRVLDSTATVTVTAASGTLTGETEINAYKGLVAFTDLVFTGSVAVDDTLTFTSPGLASADDTIRPSGPGPATTMAIQAGDNQTAVVGNAVATNPAVVVTDAVGNPVPDTSVIFTVVSGNGSLAGPGSPATVVTDDSGVAASPVWTVGTTAGVNELSATSTGLAGSPITFTATGVPDTVDSLALTQAAVGGASGSVFTTQPQVTLQDANGNVITGDDTTVITASIDGAASLIGDDTVTVVNGVATFVNLGVSGPTGNYTITYAGAGRTVTQPITISVGAPVALVVSPQADGATYANVWTTQPTVTIVDSGGNTVVDDSSTQISIGVSAGGSLGGVTTRTASGGVVTFSGLSLTGTPGTFTLTYSASGLPSVDDTIALGQASQTITFAALDNKAFGDDSFSVAASASSFLAVTLTSQTAAVCSVSGVDVTILTAGTCTIRATQAGNVNYLPATDVDQTFTVAQASQAALTITSTAGVFGTGLTLTTTGGTTAGAVTYPTVTNGTATGCSVTAGVLTVTNAGTCVVTAQMAGDANYEQVSSAATTITIAKLTPTLGVWNSATATFGDAPFVLTPPTVTGAGGANLASAGTWAYVSSNSSIATVMGTSIDPGITGTATITGTFTPTDSVNYNTVTATTTVTVTKANQSTLVISNPSTFVYGSSLNLVTTGGSGSGAVSFTVDDTASTAPGCAISGRTLTSTGTGTCVITAVKAGDPNFNISNVAAQTVTVAKANQTVSFTSTPPAMPRPFGTYAVAATSTSGLPVTLAVTTGSPAVCQLSVGVVSFNAAGTCVITASQGGDSNFHPATSVTQTIVVGSLNQSITFAQPADKNFDDPAFALTATASSGLPVRFEDDTTQMTAPYACSVDSAGVVTILAVGPCAITATQAGSAQYAPASDVTRVFQIIAVPASAPFITSVNVQNAGATLTFTPPGFDGGSAITAYQVNAIPADGGDVVRESGCSVSGSPLTCTMTGLANGTGYRFAVQAITAAGLGAASAMVPAADQAAIISAVRPNAVSGLLAIKGDTQLTARWQPLTTAQLGGGVFTEYQVSIALASGGGAFFADTLTLQSDDSYLFTGLDNGTAYVITVVAITTANNSALTGNTAIVSEVPARAPDPVEATFTPTSGTTATVSWPAPTSDGGSPVTVYNVTVTGEGGSFTCSAIPPARSCDVSGLTRGAAYAVEVEVVNAVGSSTDPATDVRQPNVPSAPVINAAAPVSVDDSVMFEVTWSAPADNGAPITGYQITATRLSALSPAGLGVTSADDTQFTCTSATTSCMVLAPGSVRDYAFVAVADNLAGTSPASVPFVVPDPTPPTPIAPSAPLGVRAWAMTKAAMVMWSTPTSAGSFPVTTYRVVAAPGGQTCLAPAAQTWCEVGGLRDGVTYTFTVSALNGAGWGQASVPSNPVTPSRDPEPGPIPGPQPVPGPVAPGDVLVDRDGAPVPGATGGPNADRDGLMVKGPGYGMNLITLTGGGKRESLTPEGVLQVRITGQISVSGDGVVPGSTTAVYAIPAPTGGQVRAVSSPVLIGVVVAGPQGTYVGSWPLALPVGEYLLQLVTMPATGGVVSVTTELSVLADDARSIMLRGSRGNQGTDDRVNVRGTTTNLDGATVQARVRLAGQTSYTSGSTRVVVDQSFSWSRVTDRKVNVYFQTTLASGEKIRSTRITIPARAT